LAWASANADSGGSVTQLVEPIEATQEMLLDVHTPEYLDKLNSSPAEIASVRAAALPS
jgi:acetoin utilization deacetylase AcuC-like enzyme